MIRAIIDSALCTRRRPLYRRANASAWATSSTVAGRSWASSVIPWENRGLERSKNDNLSQDAVQRGATAELGNFWNYYLLPLRNAFQLKGV